MPEKKIDQHRGYARHLLSSRLDVARAMHDDTLFLETKLGKELTNLKNIYHDVKRENSIHHIKKASKNKLVGNEISQKVMHLVKEIDYLDKLAKSIISEDHTCKNFTHLIENFDDYISHLEDDQISSKLREHESLLQTIYYKEVIQHLHDNSHNDNYIEILIDKFGHDKAGAAMHHYMQDSIKESGEHSILARLKSMAVNPISREEKLKGLSELLQKRSKWLGYHAKSETSSIIKNKIRDIEKKRAYWKKRTMKLLDESLEHQEELNQLYDEFTEEIKDEI